MENKEEMKNEAAAEEISGNFIHDIIDEDLRENPNLKIHTRFPARAQRISSHRVGKGYTHKLADRTQV